MPLPGSRDRRYPFRVVTHHPQYLIDRVFTLVTGYGRREDQFIITGDIPNLFQEWRWTVLRGGYAAFAFFLPRGRNNARQ